MSKKKKQQMPASLKAVSAIGCAMYFSLIAGVVFNAPEVEQQPEPINLADIIEQAEADLAKHNAESQPVILNYPSKGKNNAGNLRDRHGNFREFKTKKEGYLALADDLKAKISGDSRMMQAKYGKDYTPTIRRVVTVFAPPHENNTQHYVEFVAEHSGIHPDKKLTLADLNRIIHPMIRMEHGSKKAAIYQQYARN